MAKKPGVMLYFDILDPLKFLDYESKGRLLDAILEYSQYGTFPEFTGPVALAWGFIRPKLDKDTEAYNTKKLKSQYAIFCRYRGEQGLPKIRYEDWIKMDHSEESGSSACVQSNTDEYGRIRTYTDEYGRIPTTTTATTTPTSTSTATTTPTSTATATTAAAVATTPTRGIEAIATADKKLKFLNGELGKGVVVLSEVQIDSLLDKLGLDMFDYYVDKLASFILKNDAKISSHYGTILRWWQEDCQTEDS